MTRREGPRNLAFKIGPLALAACLMLAACEKSATTAEEKKDDTGSQSGVSLTPEQVKSLGIATSAATASSYRQKVSGYGVVVSLDTIAQADADVATAAAAAAQSEAAASRAKSLSTGEEAAVSREVVEAAQSKAAADRAALSLAERKSQSAFGLHAPWRSPAERQAIMAKLASGKAVLARVTFPLGALAGARPSEISISRLGNSDVSWTSKTIWEAPADPSLPGTGFYCLVEGSDLAQSEHLTAWVSVGPKMDGVVVPQSAILVGENDVWVYVEPEQGHFTRVRVDTTRPTPGGIFLPRDGGIAANEKVVTAGAGLLLARETNPGGGSAD